MIKKSDIFKIKSNRDFEILALKIFKFQYKNNKIYRSYCDLININSLNVKNSNDIPFLPIEFFKNKKILSSTKSIEKVFKSSGTSGSNLSNHYITNLKLYEKSFIKSFEYFFGDIKNFTILALLPSYMENSSSSLIYMVENLIKRTKKNNSGFYLNNDDYLYEILVNIKNSKTLLIGVSYALLDLIEKRKFKLSNTIILETGGMKGRRKEIIRQELHDKLKKGFGVKQISSEYGMTELLSQSYSLKNGIFKCPPRMKVLIREPQDALSIKKNGLTGGINVIDLANIYSCSFIETQDLGKKIDNNSFEVIGRFDNSDVRGCNQMV